MIQRKQTLWLLLATIAGVMSFLFPFAVGTNPVPNGSVIDIDAGTSFFLIIVSIATIGTSVIAIFLFKNRNQQMWLCVLGIFFSVLLIILYIMEMKKLIKPVPALTAVLPPLILIGFFMALIGIRKDEKLVKSLDKLR